MNNELLKNIINNIDYKTYIKIQKIIKFSGVGLFSLSATTDSKFSDLCKALSLMIVIYGETLSREREFTSDYNKIKIEYQEIVKNYNKMNKLFNLNDPIEIYTMFNHLLYNGYLSVNKKFEYYKKENDIDSKLGVNIITGQGVCRHISSLLTDILNDYGIEAYNLIVYISKEKEISLKGNDVIELVKKLINTIQEKRFEIYGNHAISYAFYDNKSYYLDSTNKFIGTMDQNKTIICDNYKFVPKFKMLKYINDKNQYLKVKQRIIDSYPSISKEEEKILIDKTINICDDNKDIFEKFYNENKEIYQEINAKVLKLKKLR